MARGVKGTGPWGVKVAAAASPQRPRAAAEPAPAQPPEGQPWAPLGSVDVDSLGGDELKRYALHAGIRQADVDYLTEDRLRQNVKLFIQNHFDLITDEG